MKACACNEVALAQAFHDIESTVFLAQLTSAPGILLTTGDTKVLASDSRLRSVASSAVVLALAGSGSPFRYALTPIFAICQHGTSVRASSTSQVKAAACYPSHHSSHSAYATLLQCITNCMKVVVSVQGNALHVACGKGNQGSFARVSAPFWVARAGLRCIAARCLRAYITPCDKRVAYS